MADMKEYLRFGGAARGILESIERMEGDYPFIGHDVSEEDRQYISKQSHDYLVDLLGFDLGCDGQAWHDWLLEHHHELPKFIDSEKHPIFL